MDFKKYSSAIAFRRALEDRLKSISLEQKLALNRLRLQVAFERFLARIFTEENTQWLLKGGYALEFRLRNIARTTKDIDLSIPKMKQPTPQRIAELLRQEAQKDLNDWFVFFIGDFSRELDQVKYGGWSFPIEAQLAGKEFTTFRLDVAVGDAVISEPEWKIGAEFLNFAGIKPARVAVFPIDQHFAEKIHSYSFPSELRTPSRTKDLIDLILLIELGLPKSEIIKKAITATFKRRKTHPIPTRLPEPPKQWGEPYQVMAEECGVSQKTLNEAVQSLNRYWQKLYLSKE